MTKNLHINDQAAAEREEALFSRLEVPSSTTKEEVWELLSNKLDHDTDQIKVRPLWIRKSLILSAAAMMVLLAGLGIFARYYTKSFHCPNGRHLSSQLPDGSVVELNAQSTLSYQPYWWYFSRQIQFEGEAFFKVVKGDSFTVESSLGTTTVLGTSFNIYSRGESYKVSCITGKVMVQSAPGDEVILEMFQRAEVDASGNIIKTENINREDETAWIRRMFHFTATPLLEVVAEVERQYNITITSNEPLDYLYTGFFSRKDKADETLDLICKPFGLTFVKQSNSHFEIIKR